MDYLQFRQIYRNDLLHYGIKRRSGRYPYGSGERPFQGEGGVTRRIVNKIEERRAKRRQHFEKLMEDQRKHHKTVAKQLTSEEEARKKRSRESYNHETKDEKIKKNEERKQIYSEAFSKRLEDFDKYFGREYVEQNIPPKLDDPDLLFVIEPWEWEYD